MGIHNRDYLRDESSGSGSWSGSYGGSGGTSSGPVSAVKVLVIINVAVFLATWLIEPLGDLLHLPATFSVAREGARLHIPAPKAGVEGLELPSGSYVVAARSGKNEFLRFRRLHAEEVSDLDASFRTEPDGWVGVETGLQLVGEPGPLTGVMRRSEIGSIAWQFPWRVITYGFCHDQASLLHLLFNMICLWMFGRLIEGIYGRREFLWIYLLGVLVSGVCHLAWQLASGGSVVPMVGASGGVMAVMVLSAVHFPKMKVLLMMIIPVELGMLVVGLVALDVIRALGAFGGESHIAHMAHLGGAAFGYGYHRSGGRLSSLGERLAGRFKFWRRRVVRPSVRVYQPPVDGLDDQVDAILAKISRDGEASLSDREREMLMEASRRKRHKT
jgi:membrane associated rhomboid family serine protease